MIKYKFNLKFKTLVLNHQNDGRSPSYDTFSGDMTNKYHSLGKLAQCSDLLVANNVIEETATDAAKNMHMPPSEIGKIAGEAKVKKVLLAHFMNRSLPHQNEAVKMIGQAYQGPVLLAEDLMVVDLNKP